VRRWELRRWFERLPIHRKLVTLALVVSAASLMIAMLGLSLIDLWRYRSTSADDATALAQVLAENVAAAVAFDNTEETEDLLGSVRVRGEVARACVYLPDGELFAGFARGTGACPEVMRDDDAWSRVAGVAPVVRNERLFGTVYVARDLSDVGRRLAVMSLAGLSMLLVAGLTAYGLAQRVHGSISRPISQLAATARAFGRDHSVDMPPIRALPDEVGELVTSFGEMTARTRAATDELRRSNEALRREIEERRRVEHEREQALHREREASRLKDEFLATVSHELRTPLNAIAGWAQILGSTNPNAETRRRATASILKNARAQARVIEDLIDVSRIVTGKLRLAFTPVDLRGIVTSGVESIHLAASGKGVRVEMRMPDHSCTVVGDRDRLQQVLWNLLSNAVKFTPAGGTVSVSLDQDGAWMVIEIADTGIGVAREFLPFVFERFRQADGSLTREHGGLGLGLAIVRDLTEMHGGVVTVTSEGRNRGARFTVRLPEYVPRDDAESSTPEADMDLGPPLNGIRVLAVDDNEDAVALMAVALTRAGAQVETATSAPDAVTLWERHACDVLVCDLAMPQMSGFEVLERIRAIDACRGRVTPAIAVSAYASEHYQARSVQAGFSGHVSKPFGAGDIVRAVARAVAHT
jgi:signal transduction histidine kinase